MWHVALPATERALVTSAIVTLWRTATFLFSGGQSPALMCLLGPTVTREMIFFGPTAIYCVVWYPQEACASLVAVKRNLLMAEACKQCIGLQVAGSGIAAFPPHHPPCSGEGWLSGEEGKRIIKRFFRVVRVSSHDVPTLSWLPMKSPSSRKIYSLKCLRRPPLCRSSTLNISGLSPHIGICSLASPTFWTAVGSPICFICVLFLRCVEDFYTVQ